MDLQLAGKRALITGSSSGIGIGIAEVLAEEGAKVVVHGRNRVRAEAVVADLSAKGYDAALAIGDLATDEGAKATAEAALAAFGGIDILVNNAGGRSSEAGVTDWSDAAPEDWMDTYNKNAVATVRMVRLLAPAMKERGWGRLIQFASSAANSPNAGIPHYAASKAAILNLTVSLSKAYAMSGVTANTISPGMIATPAVDEWFDTIAKDKGWEDDRAKTQKWVLENLVHQTVDRVGHVRDIGAMVAFLCSPYADFINGANFRIDGGRSPAVN